MKHLPDVRWIPDQGRLTCKVKYSPDSSLLAGGGGRFGSRANLVLWDARTLAEVGTLYPHSNVCGAIAFSPTSSIIASSCLPSDNIIELWSLSTLDRIGTLALVPADAPVLPHGLKRETTVVAALEFSPDSERLCAGCWDLHLKMWDLVSGHLYEMKPEHAHNVEFVSFYDDGRLILSATDESFRLWEAVTKEVIGEIQYPENDVIWKHAAAPPRVLSACANGVIRVCDTVSRKWEDHRLRFRNPVYSIDYSCSKDLLAIGLKDGRVLIWDERGKRQLGSVRLCTETVMSLAFSPDGGQLACVYARDHQRVAIVETATFLLKR